jgi:ABC-type antimicrobial peptide transport system permease subunit
MSDARMLREYFDNGAMFAVKAALRIAAIAGGGGLLLALAGLYGVVSSSVVRRRREIGIRVALGACQGTVFAMIVRQGMTAAVAGTAVGMVVGQYGSRLLRGFVPGGSSIWTGAGAVAIVLGASLIACAVSSVRALSVDPAVVLREAR